jgi:excisionase family DNA binding protein
MENPFITISDRLSKIENILSNLNIKSEKSPSKEDADQLFTIEEAAEFLHLAKATIYSKVSKGELPVMKQGKRLYFSKTELLDYLKKGRKKSFDEVEQEAQNFLKN